jgi:hypothetical protein
MEIKIIPIENIIESEYNPRIDLRPGDPEFEKIKKSIQDFGFVEPLVWNEYNKVLIGGHQRLKVLRELGYKEVEVSVVNITDRGKEKALNIALNKIQGDWDYNKLTALLEELRAEGDEYLGMTGFNSIELDSMLQFKTPETLAETTLEGDSDEALRFIISFDNSEEQDRFMAEHGLKKPYPVLMEYAKFPGKQ